MNRARRHFAEAMASSDVLVRALAQERDFLCSYVEKQFVPTLKKGQNPAGGLQVPLQSLRWLRLLFKQMSLRLKKAAARQEADHMLVRAWYGDLMTLATAQLVQPGSAASSSEHVCTATPAGNKLQVPEGKRRNTTASAPGGKGRGKATSSATTSSVNDEVTIQGEGVTVKVPKFAAPWFRPTTPAQVTKYMDANYITNGKLFRSIWGRAGKKCYLAGKGLVGHTIIRCRQLGNQCFLPCQKCKKVHWTEECSA